MNMLALALASLTVSRFVLMSVKNDNDVYFSVIEEHVYSHTDSVSRQFIVLFTQVNIHDEHVYISETRFNTFYDATQQLYQHVMTEHAESQDALAQDERLLAFI
jgi:hypothetical protein